MFCPIADGLCENARCVFWSTNQNNCLIVKMLENYIEKRKSKDGFKTNLPNFNEDWDK